MYLLISYFYISFYRSNIVREINPIQECTFKTDSTNNYDMTLFHNDELDDTQIVLSRRQLKKIPRWARSKFFHFFSLFEFLFAHFRKSTSISNY